MRGVKCSWKEMQRLHREVLPAIDRGDGERYAAIRCVQPSTVSTWKRASSVMTVLEQNNIELNQFSSFQPTHANAIARHFRKKYRPPWSGEVQDEILDWVDKCERDGLTVEDLRHALQNGHANDVAEAKSYGLVTDLNELVAQGAKFKTIYADPPWEYSNKATRSNVDKEYKSTMSGAPRMVTDGYGVILPDFDCAGLDWVGYIDSKCKTQNILYRIKKQVRHGIDFKNFGAYLECAKRYRKQCALAVLELFDDPQLHCGKWVWSGEYMLETLDELGPGEQSESSNDNALKVYWRKKDFKNIGTVSPSELYQNERRQWFPPSAQWELQRIFSPIKQGVLF